MANVVANLREVLLREVALRAAMRPSNSSKFCLMQIRGKSGSHRNSLSLAGELKKEARFLGTGDRVWD